MNLSKEQIATNLNADINSPAVDKVFKMQFLQGKFVFVKDDVFITFSAQKELSSLQVENTFGMFEDSEIEANKKRFKEILASAISLDEAYNKSI